MDIELRFVTTESLSKNEIDSMCRLFKIYYEADPEFFENYEGHVRKRTHALMVYRRGGLCGFMMLFLKPYADYFCVGMSALILEHSLWGKVPLLEPLVEGIKKAAVREYGLDGTAKVFVVSFAACVRTYFFNRKLLPTLVPSMECPRVPDELRRVRDRFIADISGKKVVDNLIDNDKYVFKFDEFSPLDEKTKSAPAFQWFLAQIGGMESYGHMDLALVTAFPNPL